jgi:outer membrane protein TolC
MKNIFLILLLITSQLIEAKAQKSFENLESLLNYAESKSISMQANDIRLLQAKKSLLASKLAIADPQAYINASFTNNTRLPINIIPAEAFGGQKGEFKEVQFGVQYNTNSNQFLDVKLLNLEGLQNYKLAKINIEISQNDAKLNRKNLRDNLATAYYNILQLYAQTESAKQNLVVADSLFSQAQRKYKQGVVKQQDINDSKVNVLNISESINQIEYLIKQNYIALKILADIPDSASLEITERINTNTLVIKPTIETNNLLIENYRLKEMSAFTIIQKTNRAFAPTISFVASNSFNKYNNEIFAGNSWITSNYVGLKLNLALPNANTLSNKYKAQYDLQLAQKSIQEATLKADLTNTQLRNDWEKAVSLSRSNAEIVLIQQDTYNKNKNLYTEGLISIDRVLNSFNAMTNAIYSLNSSKVSISLAQSKIDINNKTK